MEDKELDLHVNIRQFKMGLTNPTFQGCHQSQSGPLLLASLMLSWQSIREGAQKEKLIDQPGTIVSGRTTEFEEQ